MAYVPHRKTFRGEHCGNSSPILNSYLEINYFDDICQMYSAGPNLRLKHYNECNVDLKAIKDICKISEHL